MYLTIPGLLVLAGLLGSSSLVAPALLADEAHPDSTRVTEAKAVEFSLSDLDAYSATDTDLTDAFITDKTFGPDVEPCGCGTAANCDCKKMKELEAKAAGAYKGLFYENNFDYLCDPCYDGWHLGERLKRNCLGDWGVLDVGGQLRLRQHSERNFRGLGLTGRDDDFLLYRTRLYANLEVGSRFRAYAEYIDAQSEFENYVPLPIEVNRSDMLNLFGDLMVLDADRGQLWARRPPGTLVRRPACDFSLGLGEHASYVRWGKTVLAGRRLECRPLLDASRIPESNAFRQSPAGPRVHGGLPDV